MPPAVSWRQDHRAPEEHEQPTPGQNKGSSGRTSSTVAVMLRSSPLRRAVGRLRAVGSKRRTVFVGHARASMTLDMYSHVMPLEACEPEALQTRIREALTLTLRRSAPTPGRNS
jgi:hypothetical protein